MNTHIKNIIIIALCGLCMPAMAANRFIVKYKLNESQKAFLLAHGGDDAKEARAKIREELMEKLSKEQLDALSVVAKVQVTYLRPLANGAHVITLSNDLDETQTEQFISTVEKCNDIEFIEEDKIQQASYIQNINPTYQWDMTGVGGFSAQPKWSGDNFVNAWTILDSYGYVPGQNVVVAVLDTGYTPHSNFISSLQPLNGTTGVYGYKFISDCRMSGECPACTTDIDAANDTNSKYTPNALDLGDFVTYGDIKCPFFSKGKVKKSSWHGSHVIGTIIGNGYHISNPSYITGGAYGVRVVPVRVLGKGGATISDITNGMMWAAGLDVHNADGSPVPVNPNPAQVINMSLGGNGKCSRQYQDIIDNIVGEGAVVVIAAGNEQKNIKNVSPAGCNNVISVAAKGPTDKLASYSNFGNTTITASGGDSTILPPLLSMVKSTTWSSSYAYKDPTSGGYGIWKEMEGTSMAAPHVSAAIAILISVFKAQGKAYTHKELIDILQKSTTKYNKCNTNGCATDYVLDTEKAVNSVLTSDWTEWFYSLLPSQKTAVTAVLSALVGGCTVYFCMLKH